MEELLKSDVADDNSGDDNKMIRVESNWTFMRTTTWASRDIYGVTSGAHDDNDDDDNDDDEGGGAVSDDDTLS